jgi:P63C domain-containing protein
MEAEERKNESKAIGGHARAEALPPDRRKAIAIKAANARWRGKPVNATHDGFLTIGTMRLACANLPDGRRVISERTMMAALGRVYSGYYSQRDAEDPEGAAGVPRYLAPAGLKPYISAELIELLQPIPYITKTGGNLAKGVEAEALPQICDVWLKARADGVLGARQQKTAIQAEIIVRGLAHVGIIALIDEATGFQEDRAHDALIRILERFIAKELRPYVKTFPHDFYKEIYRLRCWNYPPDSNHHNSNLGKITNDLIYDRLAPGVRDELNRLTPRNPSGRLKHKLFQRLTPDFGHPKLREHLGAVVMAMKLSDTWTELMVKVNRLLPKYPPIEDRRGQRNLQFGRAQTSPTLPPAESGATG